MKGTPRTQESGVLPCLFDRIVRSLVNKGPNEDRSMDARSYRDAVRRDLEWLLNSKRRHSREELRQTVLSAKGNAAIENSTSVYDHEELPTSVMNYGMRDFNGAALGADAEVVLSEIRDAIRRFEPRIVAETIRIEHIKDSRTPSRLTFSIEAELWALPGWEPLRIDIDLNTGSCRVEEGGET